MRVTLRCISDNMRIALAIPCGGGGKYPPEDVTPRHIAAFRLCLDFSKIR
jgi:hypothetical protein